MLDLIDIQLGPRRNIKAERVQKTLGSPAADCVHGAIKHGASTESEIIRATGLPEVAVRVALRGLQTEGRVRRVMNNLGGSSLRAL